MLIGIVGKTNVGKSTFFRALTLAPAEISARPFTTIKPNRGIAYVKVRCPCKDFDLKCNPKNSFCLAGWRFAPVEVLDVAGLVPGAHAGRGLGNKFLDDLRQADAFVHVLDISGSTDEEGKPIPRGSYDPLQDVRFLEEEIDLWFSGILRKNWSKIVRLTSIAKKDFDKEIAKQLSGLGIKLEHVSYCLKKCELAELKPREWKDEDILKFTRMLRKVSKPMIIAANKIDIPGSEENFDRLKKELPGYHAIKVCSEAELALREAMEKKLIFYIPGERDFQVLREEELNEAQKRALNFIEKRILQKFESTGVQDVLNELLLKILKACVVFPVEDEHKLCDKRGNILPDAHLMPRGSTAFDLAKKVHSELTESFVRAIDCRTKKVIGRGYELKNGDVIKVVF
jgi:hypothetical protein